MNGTRISSLIRFAGLALLAACFVAGHANAQDFSGKFTLPFEARWGQATLPAGDYSLTVNSLNTICTVYRGQNAVAMIPAQSTDKTYSGHAALSVEQGTVRSLRLPDLGIILQYSPQQPKHRTAPQERETAQLVPVAAVGK
jgi:hypothetical protein